MSRLEFFCNRPTLVALIDFGLELSSWSSAVSNLQIAEDLDGEALLSREKAEGNENAFVKGLLGHGKGRAVFHLNLNVDSVSVFLNKEDDSQFAMFVQESFQLDLKVSTRLMCHCFQSSNINYHFHYCLLWSVSVTCISYTP